MSNIDVFNTSKEDLIKLIHDNFSTKRTWWSNIPYSAIHWLNREQDGANFRFKYFRVDADYDGTTQIATGSLAIKLICPPASRPFFIKIPSKVNVQGFAEPFDYETLIFCSAKVPGVEPYLPSWFSGSTYISNIIRNSGNHNYTEHDNTIRQSLGFYDIYDSGARVDDWCYWRMGGDPNQFGGVVHRNWTNAQKATIASKIRAILQGVTYGTAHHFNIMDDFPGWETQWATFYNGYGLGRYETNYFMTYDELPAPLFDYTQTTDIIKYINTGDDSGAIDPFDIKNPEEKIITDYKTNFRVFLSAYENDRTKTHYTVVAYNSQYVNGEDFNAEYEMNVYEGRQTGQPLVKLGSAKDNKYPTLSYYNKLTPGVLYTNFMNFQDTTNEVGSSEKSSGYFGVTFTGKDNSAVKATVGSVTWSQSADGSGQQLSKTNIVDGYRFTAPSGEYLEVIFRAIDLKDLNDGYAGDPDNEDDQTGTDADFIAGGGYNTFSIDSAQFKTINDALWSTDWSTVFKSNTIDPIKCVIGCKSIPFNANASSSAEIVIANLDTGVSANTVKPMKSISAGSVLMPSFRKDFTDINLCKVHLYLPFIGWTDLPAAEVMSRAPYNDVGVEARPKRLAFKYLIDFVDGNCRCVVSVNGTERWYFDGNCAVDIPLTSDNHTGAISAAIRNGAAALLSVGAAVASYASSNAVGVVGGVLGAAQNAANTVPTYDYHASCSPSGYIEASMNNHIMIIIERPNIKLSDNYAHKVGRPCGLTLNLGSLHGFTKCTEVNLTGVNGTPEELAQIKAALERGVYL